MSIPFSQFNEELLGALAERRDLIEHKCVLANQAARILQEGGHRLHLLPVNFVFDERACAVLADAASVLAGIQTKVLRHLAESVGHDGILEMFGVPEGMRRFVNWQELLDPECLVGRFDILQSRDGYHFCEFNIDSCVAAAEIFEFASEYLSELGISVEDDLGLEPPLTILGALIARTAQRKHAARVVILDWSVGGGSAGKGYLSFERARGHFARAADPVPVFIADEKSYAAEWLTPEEATRTFVFRGFMMDEMDDGGAFLDRLIALGTPIVSTYESEIRMNKGWFALFHNESILAILNRREQELIRKYIPITYDFDARNSDSLIEHKDDYVFKEKQSFGGKGIHFGETTPAEELKSLLDEDGAGRWIAQEVVQALPAIFPHDDRFQSETHNLVFGMYLYGSRAHGMLVRGSTHSKVVNVTIGNAKLAWAFCVGDTAKAALVTGLLEGCGVGA